MTLSAITYSELKNFLVGSLPTKERKAFLGFTIDSNLLEKAYSNAIILHCLPAYRSKEITDEAFESKKSRIFEQAENRLHVQQSLLAALL